MLLTSRSVARRRVERRDVCWGLGEEEDWSRVEESQDCWTEGWDCGGVGEGAGVVLCGFGGC